MTFHVILYGTSGNLMRRQTVPLNGRYRFMNIRNGEYYLAIEMEGREITRYHLNLTMLKKMEIRRDIKLEWREAQPIGKPPEDALPPEEDIYRRDRKNAQLFRGALQALSDGEDNKAEDLLRRITTSDEKDYQAWTELGSLLHNQENISAAEAAYRRALTARPSYSRAILNLGRLHMALKKYEGAADLLARAVELKPESADAHYLLGEAYLQLRKGSQAVKPFHEALRLDPIGKADAHLRLAALYNAAGLKSKAAQQYRQFIAKIPDHPERDKFLQYIKKHKLP
jgi:tetratricopeptide (TPR) repeat protein